MSALARNLHHSCGTHWIYGHLESSPFLKLTEATLHQSLRETSIQEHEALSRYFDGQLRVVAKRSATVWFNRDRLDRLLGEYVGVLRNCELIYAIDAGGRQVSSNIHPDSIDVSAYGQDLSKRPYAVSLSMLNNVASHGAFECRTYVSKITQRPCVTVMYGVNAQSSLLGYITADISHLAE